MSLRLKPSLYKAALPFTAGVALIANDALKLRVLKALRSGERTVNALRKSTGGGNYVSVQSALDFLERAGLVQRERRTISDGAVYVYVRLTALGEQVAKRL